MPFVNSKDRVDTHHPYRRIEDSRSTPYQRTRYLFTASKPPMALVRFRCLNLLILAPAFASDDGYGIQYVMEVLLTTP